MTDETQLLTILEEVLKGIEELKKKQPKDGGNNFAPINDKLATIGAQISIIKQLADGNTSREEMRQMMARIDEIKQIRQKEVKHVYVDVKNPLAWIIGAVLVIVLSSYISYYYYQKAEDYKYQSNKKDWNYMKYRYLEVYGSPGTQKEMKDFDVKYHYKTNYLYYDSLTIAREKKNNLEKQREAQANAAAAEAKRLQQQADSLRNK